MKAIVYPNTDSFDAVSAVSALARAWNLHEKQEKVYTYADDEHVILTLEQLENGPNEVEHVLTKIPYDLEAPKGGSHLGQFLDDDGLVGVSRLCHVTNFFTKDFAGRELLVMSQAIPEFNYSKHMRYMVAFRDLCEVYEDGSFKSRGRMKRERPVQAKIGFARTQEQVDGILNQTALLLNSMKLPTPVSFKMNGDCLIAYPGSPLDETWSTRVISPNKDAKDLPTITVYLARTGSYARNDLGFTTIMDGRTGKRFTDYNKTRQPFSLDGIDIIAHPVLANEVYTSYLGAKLIGEDVADFYGRKEDFFSCSDVDQN